jgi:hypothetical protein
MEVKFQSIKYGQLLIQTNYERKRKLLNDLPTLCLILATIVIVVLAIRVWQLFPTYSDEIAYRFFLSRAFFDGFERISLMPFCGLTSSLKIPIVYYPAAIAFASYSLIADVAYNRVVAVFFLIMGFAVFAFALQNISTAPSATRRSADSSTSGGAHLAFCAALLMCCIGVLPATYVILRGESASYILAPLLILCFSNFRPRRTAVALAIAAGILLLFTMSVYAHPKFLYFVPAVGISLVVLLWQRSRIGLGIVLFYFLWATIEGLRIDYLQFATCSQTPEFESLLGSFNIDPASILVRPIGFLQSVFENANIERLAGIVGKTSFVGKYDVGYLPGLQADIVTDAANALIAGCWLLLAGVSIAAVIWYCLRIYVLARGGRPSPEQSKWPELLDCSGMLGIYAAVTVHFLLNRTAWWYDCGNWFFLYTILGTASLLRIARSQTASRRVGASAKSAVWMGVSLTVAAAALSTYVSGQTFYHSFRDGFVGPGLSIARRDLQATKQNIQSSMNRCGLSPVSPRLIVDDLTYPFLQTSTKPILVTYATRVLSSDQAIERAKALGSSGIVFRCEFASSFPNISFAQEGGICCSKFEP